jgi:hypothetical protein
VIARPTGEDLSQLRVAEHGIAGQPDALTNTRTPEDSGGSRAGGGGNGGS